MTADPFLPVLSRLGSRFDPDVLDTTVAHWAPRVSLRLGQAAPAVLDIAYGDHARHRIDIFPAKGQGAPIVLFVHGGGFVAGDKQLAAPFYSNIGRYFASHGMVGACMNYRLAPAGGWPAGAQDVDAAVHWLLDRGDLYGGDPRRLVVVGQSAGACHVATWLLDRQFQGDAREKIRGAALMSGFYLAQSPLSPGQRAYFGDDAAMHAQRSPLNMVRKLSHPLLVTIASHDPPQLHTHGQELAAALEAAGSRVTLSELQDHNHVSPVMSMGSDNDTTGTLLRRFVKEATADMPNNQ
jgi:acetyl esterase/lipase